MKEAGQGDPSAMSSNGDDEILRRSFAEVAENIGIGHDSQQSQPLFPKSPRDRSPRRDSGGATPIAALATPGASSSGNVLPNFPPAGLTMSVPQTDLNGLTRDELLSLVSNLTKMCTQAVQAATTIANSAVQAHANPQQQVQHIHHHAPVPASDPFVPKVEKILPAAFTSEMKEILGGIETNVYALTKCAKRKKTLSSEIESLSSGRYPQSVREYHPPKIDEIDSRWHKSDEGATNLLLEIPQGASIAEVMVLFHRWYHITMKQLELDAYDARATRLTPISTKQHFSDLVGKIKKEDSCMRSGLPVEWSYSQQLIDEKISSMFAGMWRNVQRNLEKKEKESEKKEKQDVKNKERTSESKPELLLRSWMRTELKDLVEEEDVEMDGVVDDLLLAQRKKDKKKKKEADLDKEKLAIAMKFIDKFRLQLSRNRGGKGDGNKGSDKGRGKGKGSDKGRGKGKKGDGKGVKGGKSKNGSSPAVPSPQGHNQSKSRGRGRGKNKRGRGVNRG